ncbi:hypothetical protein VPH35_087543 [Triticum aestivum]
METREYYVRNIPYSHSLLRSIRRALLKSGERTLATAGSHDFTDDDFFPDLGNLFLNDMGDNLNANGAAPVAAHSRFMDGMVDASKEPFVHCYECPMPFCGSPANMVLHLMDACNSHCWPLAENIKYDTCYRFTMPESLEDHRRLLVSEEDGSVFLLIMGTGEAYEGRCPVSVMWVRGVAADADTNTRQMYGCVVSVTAPPGRVGGDTGLIGRTWTLGSWDYPANVDWEYPWDPLPTDAVHGDSKEVHMDIHIIKCT